MHERRTKNFYIRDPVSGDLQIDDEIAKIIEAPEFQRLRYVKQMGFSYLVFPGAHHTRFEHSLGTWNVTKDIYSRVSDSEDNELYVAGLLHDIGHMPLSHESENPLYPYIRMMHEEVGKQILERSSILDTVGDFGMSKSKIIRYFDGIGRGKIVTGPIGSDRMDYLVRDAYYTGVAYGMIDYHRIRNLLTLYMGEPSVYLSGIDAVESFFIARYYMNSSVYLHHAVLTANAMYRKALRIALESGDLDPYTFMYLNDQEAMSELKDIEGSSNLIGRILDRKLFKRAYFNPNLNSDITENELAEIAQKAGLDETEYIAEIHRLKGNEDSIKVLSKDKKEVGTLKDISDIFKILTAVMQKRRIAIVACDIKHAKKLGALIEKAL
ncbi:MAG: HD domain-containing protein [Methanothrix sp.]